MKFVSVSIKYKVWHAGGGYLIKQCHRISQPLNGILRDAMYMSLLVTVVTASIICGYLDPLGFVFVLSISSFVYSFLDLLYESEMISFF